MTKKIFIPHSFPHSQDIRGYNVTEKKHWSKDELMKEIELISLKKSNISLSNRKWVVEQVRAFIRENKFSPEEIVKLESL
jgi:hypothetical protein